VSSNRHACDDIHDMRTVAVLGTFDSKGTEHGFLGEMIQKCGCHPLLIDVGILGQPQIDADISREDVALVGGISLEEVVRKADRGDAIAAMSRAATAMALRLAKEDKIHGIISLGGTGGTAIGTAVMRALPIGFPKVMVSTVAASEAVRHYVGTKDIVMMPSIVDVSGLNQISRLILTRAAGAISGMTKCELSKQERKPVVVASMFGNTTPCVNKARELLEANGYEVLVFHATGIGGKTMEALIESGVVDGVLDITTTEWADELVGGVLSAGPQRLEAAAKYGIPAIVTPGCLDMVNFGPPETVPARFRGRLFYQHNPQVTLMRTSPKECSELGRIIAEKVNLSTGPVTVLIPQRAISAVGAIGQPFHDADADAALFLSLQRNLRPDLKVICVDSEINEVKFAEACVEALMQNIAAVKKCTI
jgi:uncharacterized protein (UPF0261 family)